MLDIAPYRVYIYGRALSVRNISNFCLEMPTLKALKISYCIRTGHCERGITQAYLVVHVVKEVGRGNVNRSRH